MESRGTSPVHATTPPQRAPGQLEALPALFLHPTLDPRDVLAPIYSHTPWKWNFTGPWVDLPRVSPSGPPSIEFREGTQGTTVIDAKNRLFITE